MKKTIIICLLALIGSASQAQNFNEWFRQKKTQRKYLVEQIAALEVYKGYVKKGYEIVGGGLNLIDDIKKGDFSLHKNYFDGLQSVNPQIRHYAQISKAVLRQVKIIQACQQTIRKLNGSGMMKTDEVAYVKRTFDRVLEDVAQVLEELELLISDGQIGLKDDERLNRIDALNRQSEEMYGFVIRFGNEAIHLGTSRYREYYENKRMGGYYDIPE